MTRSWWSRVMRRSRSRNRCRYRSPSRSRCRSRCRSRGQSRMSVVGSLTLPTKPNVAPSMSAPSSSLSSMVTAARWTRRTTASSEQMARLKTRGTRTGGGDITRSASHTGPDRCHPFSLIGSIQLVSCTTIPGVTIQRECCHQRSCMRRNKVCDGVPMPRSPLVKFCTVSGRLQSRKLPWSLFNTEQRMHF